MRFRDRTDAGRMLGAVLADKDLYAPVVLALPRGGVPVAAEVSRVLGVGLEVFVARKVGAPGHPEYGIGAVAEGGGVVIDRRATQALGVSEEELSGLVEAERRELARRVRLYRGDRALPSLVRREVVLVDDGLATGVTAEAALLAVRQQRPQRLVLGVPVASPESAARLRDIADDVACVAEPRGFQAVGQYYTDFDQTTDDDVVRILDDLVGPVVGRSGPAGRPHVRDRW